MNIHSSRRLCAVAAVLALLGSISTAGAAQQGSIAGRITDRATGSGISGARVLLGGTNRSALSNAEGRYLLLAVAPGPHDVRVSIIGYAALKDSVTVTADQQATRDFALTPAPVSLDVVEVNATGEHVGRELGNPIANIHAPDIVQQAQPSTFAELLSGRAANVQVLSSGGTVGAGSRIRIRGQSSVSLSNEPVYYVDGIKVEAGGGNAASLSVNLGGQATSRFNDINPEDIESIEIVKGPAAATLYGTQAGNGVVRITTKRGVAGKPQWLVYSELGVLNDKNNYPVNYYSWGHSLSTGAIRQCLLISSVGPSATCAIDSLTSFNVLRDPTTTPYGTGYRGIAGVQVSGGNDQTRYYLSGEYSDDIGVLRMPAAEYSRLTTERAVDTLSYNQYRPNAAKAVSARLNLQTNLSSNADVTVAAGLVQNNARLPQNDNNVTGMLGSGLFGKGWPTSFASTLPPLPPGAAQGRQWGFFLPGDVFSTLSEQDITRFTSSVQANWRPTTAITGRATVGLDYTTRQDFQFQQLNQGPAFIDFRQGRRQDNRFQLAHYTVDASATATRSLTPEFSSRTSVGVQYLKDLSFGVFAQGQHFPPGGAQTGNGAIQTDSESTVESITLGGFGEEVIGWKERRFLTIGLRGDDNSAFGKSFKAVYYPKVQGSWVVSEEPFFPNTHGWLSSVRLRAAYGASGVSPGSIDALRYYQGITAAVAGRDNPSLTIAAVGNDSLKPERSSELELGVDADVARSRAHVEFTYYHKKTTDALISRILPPSRGAAQSRFENLGSTLNKGIEGLISVNLEVGSALVDATLSGSHNTNKLVALGTGVQPITQGDIRQVPGYPLNGFWARPILGFNDANGNGIIEPSEVTVGDTAVYLGSSIPTTEFALNAGITLFHNRVRIGGQLDYRGGYKADDFTDWFRCTSGAANNCRAVNDKSAPLADQAAAAAARTLAYSNTTAGFIVDGTFLALRELAVTYYAPDAWARAFGGSRLSLTATARNLAKWTNYTGIDPELNGNGQADQPIDFLTAPLLRTFTFRLNVGF